MTQIKRGVHLSPHSDLLFVDRAVETVLDRGIHQKVGSHEWRGVCTEMETAFRLSDFEGGVLGGGRL